MQELGFSLESYFSSNNAYEEYKDEYEIITAKERGV